MDILTKDQELEMQMQLATQSSKNIIESNIEQISDTSDSLFLSDDYTKKKNSEIIELADEILVNKLKGWWAWIWVKELVDIKDKAFKQIQILEWNWAAVDSSWIIPANITINILNKNG